MNHFCRCHTPCDANQSLLFKERLGSEAVSNHISLQVKVKRVKYYQTNKLDSMQQMHEAVWVIGEQLSWIKVLDVSITFRLT